MFKRTVICFMAMFMLASGQAFAAPAVKIAVVDLQKAVSECREGMSARDVVVKKADEVNAELKKMNAELEKARAELEKGGAKMSPDARSSKEKQFQKKARDLQNRQREAQEELKQIEAESLKKLLARLGVIMGRIGDEGGYSAILDKRNGVFYSNRDIDITAQLIKKADEENAGK